MGEQIASETICAQEEQHCLITVFRIGPEEVNIGLKQAQQLVTRATDEEANVVLRGCVLGESRLIGHSIELSRGLIHKRAQGKPIFTTEMEPGWRRERVGIVLSFIVVW
ncbi:unnamed protein product [marine sediment metagenome]|uniref:Uncharacterized protein n=1 Tax=marine sediment metagenome TaxID=412755 RepID=X1D6Y6_9ZZZZ